MRTTLTIDDDVLDAVKSIAASSKVSIGEALSELVRKGINAPVGTRRHPQTGWLMFDVAGTRPFGLEEVQRAMDDEDLEHTRSIPAP